MLSKVCAKIWIAMIESRVFFDGRMTTMETYTADICDEYPEKTRVLGPGYQNFGGADKCQGTVTTIKLDNNNADLVALLRDEDGEGKIVVADVDQAYFAVVGENLMKFA